MKYKYTTLSRTDDFLDSIPPIYEESKIMQAIQDACAKSGLLLERGAATLCICSPYFYSLVVIFIFRSICREQAYDEYEII